MIRYHDQKQFDEERVYLILQFVVCHPGKSGQVIDEEAMEECFLLACSIGHLPPGNMNCGQIAWSLPHQSLRECTTGFLATGQFDGDIFPPEVLFLND